MTAGFPAPTVVDRATLQGLLTLPDVAPGAYAVAQAEEAVTGADLVVTTTAAAHPGAPRRLARRRRGRRRDRRR